MTESLIKLFEGNPSSPDMTRELKELGNGDMQNGIKTVLEIGRIQGAFATLAISALFCVSIAVPTIIKIKKENHRKRLFEERQIIIDKYEENLQKQDKITGKVEKSNV